MLMVNGVAAPLTSIARVNGVEQINFQAPFEVAGSNSAVLQVRNGQSLSQPVMVTVLSLQPGIFTTDGERGIAVHGNSARLVTPDDPAERGEVVVIYATGLGAVDPQLGTGVAAPPGRLTFAQGRATVMFGQVAAQPDFAGLTPGFAGLFQINVRVPDSAASGDVDLSLEIDGVASPSVLFAVRQ
jgi:uncharacterized protein (TIGR03437 family)